MSLVTPEGEIQFQCPEEHSILDAAAAQGVVLPAVCRGGACSTCIAQFVAGVLPDQSEQSYLSQADIEQGYVLLCVAYPRGDCRLITHRAQQYLQSLVDSAD